MNDNIKKPTVSLSVTAYNESARGNCEWLMECLAPAVDNDFIDEIVVVNDGTLDFAELASMLRSVPKLRLVQNPTRLHVFGNKLESVWQSTSEWVLMCDSDNIMDGTYYKTLEAQMPWNKSAWYCASRAKPVFDYRGFVGTWKLNEVVHFRPGPSAMYWCFLNTGNQFIHRESFLSLFGWLRGKRFDLEQPNYFGQIDRQDEKWFLAYGAADSFYMLKEWLMAGNVVTCVADLEYEHRAGTGQNSNFERGPREKDGLPPIYFLEMCDKANGVHHGYTFEFLLNRQASLIRDDNKRVIVLMDTCDVLFG